MGASITALVLNTLGENGPASVLQIVDNAEITGTVGRMVQDLKLSGVFGFDFIIEEGTGAAWLIEMNPRATQISHLNLGPGRDLPTSLRALFCDEPVRHGVPATSSHIIALFPQEWLRDPASRYLKSGYHDVPWEEPGLVRASLRDDFRSTVWSFLSARGASPMGLLRACARPVPMTAAGAFALRFRAPWGRGGERRRA
jgi:hypothetical protein